MSEMKPQKRLMIFLVMIVGLLLLAKGEWMLMEAYKSLRIPYCIADGILMTVGALVMLMISCFLLWISIDVMFAYSIEPVQILLRGSDLPLPSSRLNRATQVGQETPIQQLLRATTGDE